MPLARSFMMLKVTAKKWEQTLFITPLLGYCLGNVSWIHISQLEGVLLLLMAKNYPTSFYIQIQLKMTIVLMYFCKSVNISL